jgi:putative transposase
MIVNLFPKTVKDILRELPKNDYPILNSCLFVEFWLADTQDNSLTSIAILLNLCIPYGI